MIGMHVRQAAHARLVERKKLTSIVMTVTVYREYVRLECKIRQDGVILLAMWDGWATAVQLRITQAC